MPGKKSAPPHPRTQNRFREREVARAMRAAKASGMPIKEITIDPKTGKIGIVLVGAAGAETGAAARDDSTRAKRRTPAV
jgi:hypothetical protein